MGEKAQKKAAPAQALPVRVQLRTLAREEHGISRKNISQAALRVLYRLHEAGFDAFLVGGAVRDLMLGGHPKDFDVATNATPEQVRGLFRNCRLIGRRFRLAHVVYGQEIVEVATFRGLGEEGAGGDRHLVDGRIVRDNVYGSIEEDAIRRDFRINALYYNIADFSVRDYVGGAEDLQSRVLHLIGDPVQRYREDPVRMLRGVRLAAKLDFEIHPTAKAPFAELGVLLAEAAPARLFDESLKMFLGGHGEASFRELEHSGLMPFVFPATAAALAQDRDGRAHALIESGLANTDARIEADKSVTPAFLFALLLWEPVRMRAQHALTQGVDAAHAWSRAAHQVLAEQMARVAVPRRFSIVMEEIWELQPRFEQRIKKRVFRLMAHPRFRAAYDFLALRAEADAELAELAEWWRAAQEMPHDELATALSANAALPAASKTTGASSDPEKKKRRRRRRRGAKKGNGTAGESSTDSE
jgi:poly(A) polymerase